MLRRSGAHEGDLVFVTGTVGDAGAGLAILQSEGDDLSEVDRDFLVRRYLLPEPRLVVGGLLKGIATSSLDVSDGLLADFSHIADVSAVAIKIVAAQIPLSPALVNFRGAGGNTIMGAATAGDDYEIAFTAPSSFRQILQEIASKVGVAITEIGQVEAGCAVALFDESGQVMKVESPGFTHF